MISRVAAALVVALTVAACQNPPTVPSAGGVAASDPAADARAAMVRRDWRAAREFLQQALSREPQSVSLHYALATCATYLDDRELAVAEFRWVLEHALAGSEEQKAATGWLADAGLRVDAPIGGASISGDERPIGGVGVVRGTVRVARPGGGLSPKEGQLLVLIGLPDSPAKDMRYRVRSREDGSFEFKTVAPGVYKLTDRIAGPVTWRLRVQVEANRELAIDLSPDNSAKVRDDFPESSG